ncbi:hypothetical protein ABPG74_017183 [Tetrahymena malaccensis]
MIIKQIITIVLLLTLSQADIIEVQLQKQSLNNLHHQQYSLNTLQEEVKGRFLYSSSKQSVDLSHLSSDFYIATVLIGSNKTRLSLQIDTTSSKIIVPTQDCIKKSKCSILADYYNCTQQDGCTQDYQQQTKNYFDGLVSGYNANTTVGVSGLFQTKQSIFLIKEAKQSISGPASGILGLSVNNLDNQKNSSFVTILYEQGQIPRNMFSLYLGFSNIFSSELTLGGYNSKKLENPSEIYNHNISINNQKQEQQWIIPVQKIQLDTFSNTLNPQNNLAIIDSTYPYLGVETGIYQAMGDYFVQKGAKLKDKFYQIDCNTNLGDIQFTISDSNSINRNYSIPFSFYTEKSSDKCKILIQSIDLVDNIGLRFGYVYLRRYVSMFDYSNKTVSFAQSVADPDDAKFPTWAIILIAVAASILVLAGIGYAIYRCRMNKKKTEYSQTLLSNTSI